MKILYVADRINSPDGSSVHCRAFVKSVQELGHEIRSYPALGPIPEVNPRGRNDNKNILHYLKKINLNTLKHYLHRSNPYVSEIVTFLEGWEQTIRDFLNLDDIANDFVPDAVVFRYRLFNFAPFWIAEKYKIPIICEINALKSMESLLMPGGTKATAITRWQERKAISRANAIFTVSAAIKARVASIGGKRRAAVSVIPNGVDTDLFKPDVERRKKIRSQLKLSGKKVIGYVGSYKGWHGLDTALDVIEFLAGRNPDFHLLLVGHGHQFEAISAQISARKLDACVTQTGVIEHKHIPEYLSAFDYALMTYPKLENFYFSPLKMFEYMSMGIQVVSTDVGQISEIISHGETGWLVAEPSAKQFEEVILEAEKRTDSIGNRARKLMLEQFSWRNNAEKILRLTNSVK